MLYEYNHKHPQFNQTNVNVQIGLQLVRYLVANSIYLHIARYVSCLAHSSMCLLGHSTSNEMIAHALRPRILFKFC